MTSYSTFIETTLLSCNIFEMYNSSYLTKVVHVSYSVCIYRPLEVAHWKVSKTFGIRKLRDCELLLVRLSQKIADA